MAYKPFKMKGSPMERNFNIGKTESPDSSSPYNLDLGTTMGKIGLKLAGSGIDWKNMGLKSLASGMSTLKGGFDAYDPDSKENKNILGNIKSMPGFEDIGGIKDILAKIDELKKKTIEQKEDDE